MYRIASVPPERGSLLDKKSIMIDTPRYDSYLVSAHTTAATASVARWVAQHHSFPVQQCHLIRRGLNDNYALRAADQ